jgi:hypothetical protein
LKSNLLRAGAAIGTAALSLSAVLISAPAAHAVDTGNLVVTVVDQYGRPVAGVVETFTAPGGTIVVENGAGGGGGGAPYVFGTTHTFTGIEATGYAFESITPWGGLDCAGVEPCGVATAPSAYNAVVTVPANGTATYTIHTTLPTVSGSPAVGSPLGVSYSQGYQQLIPFLSVYGGGAPPTQQWTRTGTDVPSATTMSYTPVPADSAQQLAVRLMPSAGQQLIFGSYGSGTLPPYTTPPVTVAKFKPAKTKTKLSVPKSIQVGSRVSLKIKVKAKGGGAPDGRVTVTIGQLKIQKKIKEGSVFVNLPNLKAGSYKISVAYSGSDYFAKSKAKTSITVHK